MKEMEETSMKIRDGKPLNTSCSTPLRSSKLLELGLSSLIIDFDHVMPAVADDATY